MSKTMDFDAALVGLPQYPAPADNIFADLPPAPQAFAGIDAKHGKQHSVLVLDVSGSMAGSENRQRDSCRALIIPPYHYHNTTVAAPRANTLDPAGFISQFKKVRM